MINQINRVSSATKIRLGFVVIALCWLVLSIPQVFSLAFGVTAVDGSDGMIATYDYSKPQISFVAEDAANSSFSLLQIALVFVAASWGLIAIERDELQHPLDRMLFLLGSTTLGMSCYSYHRFHSELVGLIQQSSLRHENAFPDLRDNAVLEMYYSQVFSIVGGALCFAFSVIGSKWLKFKSE